MKIQHSDSSILICSFVCSIAILSNVSGQTAEPGPPPSGSADTHAVVLTPAYLNQLAEELRTNNLALQAAEARVEAAEQNTRSIRTWEDPMIVLGGMGAPKMMRAEDGDIIYGVEQKLPLFGKPRAARNRARAEAATAATQRDSEFQLLRLELARAAFRLALTDDALAIGNQDLLWLRTMTAATEERYAAGTATQPELLRLQNEQAKRREMLVTEARRREHEAWGLNRLLNRPLESPWPVLRLPDLAGPLQFSRRLATLAVRNEPQLKIMAREIEEAEASVEQARRARWPDLFLGVEGRTYSGNGDFRQGMVTLSLNIPLGNSGKYRAEIERESARMRAATLAKAQEELNLLEEVHGLVVAIDAARREALLYRDQIIPRSEQALESAQAAWTANKGDFTQTLEARRMLIEARLMYSRAVAEQYLMMAELVLCCGLADLEALDMLMEPDSDAQPEN